MTDTSTAPEAAPGTIQIDYGALADAILDRQASRAAAMPIGQVAAERDLGPYPHVFIDGVFQPDKSGENCTDPLERELSGLDPLPGAVDNEPVGAGVPG